MTVSYNQALRQRIQQAIEHLDHVLPGQAPIHDFVHHNTLHGFQHLPFEQALAEFKALTGIDAYLSHAHFRQFYQQGRIDDNDLEYGLQQLLDADLSQTVLQIDKRAISKAQLYKQLLLMDDQPLTVAVIRWRLAQAAPSQRQLWQALVAKFQFDDTDPEPWSLNGISAERLTEVYQSEIHTLFASVGEQLSLRSLLLALTGIDILETLQPYLIRSCATVLDEGLAAWHLPEWQTDGWYQSWRQTLDFELLPVLHDLQDAQAVIEALPEQPLDAIIQQLEALAIPVERWAAYLQRLALELPGWAGLINWRQQHPDYQRRIAPRLADYLAIRLVLDRLYLQQLCRQQHLPAPRLDKLQHYFSLHPAEFGLRQALFAGQVPESLAAEVQKALSAGSDGLETQCLLAGQLYRWQQQQVGQGGVNHQQLWQLMQLCQQLAIDVGGLGHITSADGLRMLQLAKQFSQQQQSLVWLHAYEHHYQQQLLQALHANHQRGRWASRQQRPEAQIIFCMDDREEGIRRHLEEHNPNLETLGAAGFFGMAINYRSLDDTQLTALCPVVVTPAHSIEEQPLAGQQHKLARRQQGRAWQQAMARLVFHGLRRDTWLAYPLTLLMAPVTLVGLLAKSFFPQLQQQLLQRFSAAMAPPLVTELQINASQPQLPATPEMPRQGFTDQEQADRVAAFLRNTGLTYGFGQWVVLMGHGSVSQNNPHLAAYDCGACSGRHGGPNARVFAAIANRPEIRGLLAERGIEIPDDTWFVGAEHNTGNEMIDYYDLQHWSVERQAGFKRLQQQLAHAQQMSAHERCRRLASAPRRPRPVKALQHFLNRSSDFSQARPELGHATNAAAFIGRRSQTQGAFFDRRLFLISYDPTQDADGKILEGILLAVGPVGAGINLEYYFSTVNNQRLGCGSKVPHNLTGFFAVMEGASSDLRTGLPRQMIEIHEAMRLQIVVEASTAILEQIYARQPSLQELIGGGWVHLSSKDPHSGDIFVFRRGQGFLRWQPGTIPLALRDSSADCYRDHREALEPMLIRQPAGVEA